MWFRGGRTSVGLMAGHDDLHDLLQPKGFYDHSSIHPHLLLKTFQGRTFCIFITLTPHVHFSLGHSVSGLADRVFSGGKEKPTGLSGHFLTYSL